MIRRAFITVLLCTVLSPVLPAQSPVSGPPPTQVSGSDSERTASFASLRTTGRILHITAHPGDEDGALMLQQSRELGARVTLLTLTRGEHADNMVGPSDPTEVALRRTLEQLNSDEIYGVAQRFTRAIDFGYTRSAADVFARWGDRDRVLADIVRVIREEKPDVIMTPFDGTVADGDGLHQAAAILAREAYLAAANPQRFPEQLREGLETWHASKLYGIARANSYSFAFDANSATNGQTWSALAQQALSLQYSQQGRSDVTLPPERHYRLAETILPIYGDAPIESDVLQGVATDLSSLASRAGVKDKSFRALLSKLNSTAQALQASRSAQDLGAYYAAIKQLQDRLAHLDMDDADRAWLGSQLEAKRDEAARALLASSAVQLRAELKADRDSYDDPSVLVPGNEYNVSFAMQSGASSARLAGFDLVAEGHWTPKKDWDGHSLTGSLRGRVPFDAPYSRPYFIADSREDSVYRLLDARAATLPLQRPAMQVRAQVEIGGVEVETTVPVMALAERGSRRNVAIEPAVSVIIDPVVRVMARTPLSQAHVDVRVRSNVPLLDNAMLTLHAPDGWRLEPEHQVLQIDRKGEEHTYRFYLVQQRGGEGRFDVSAAVRWRGQVFDQGYTVVEQQDGDTQFAFRPSSGQLVALNVKLPEDIQIGYIAGSGDGVPQVLRDLGLRVTEIAPDELEHGRLSRYWTIVLGAHAVDLRQDVRRSRNRLLDFVRQGGTLIVQRNSQSDAFSDLAPLPYELQTSDTTVLGTKTQVEIPDADDDLVSTPNDIHAGDFLGWSGDLADKVASRWDGRYETVLELSEPGQPTQTGALLHATYGRGTVIYSALSLDRQLLQGDPGAIRLFINLLSQSVDSRR